jgi:hypothetical protein
VTISSNVTVSTALNRCKYKQSMPREHEAGQLCIIQESHTSPTSWMQECTILLGFALRCESGAVVELAES